MSAPIVLVLVVVTAYLATHVAADWVTRRLNVVSGAEYLLLGILLGPQVSGLVSGAALRSFEPLTALALGWVGTLIGMQFHLPALTRIKGVTYRLAFAEAVLTLAVVAGVEWMLFRALGGLDVATALGPALALGAVAVASTPTGIALATRHLPRRVPVVAQLELATAIDALVAIGAFGVLLCAAHAPLASATMRSPTATEWVVISVGIGIVGGALFQLFLGADDHEDRPFVSVAGAVIFTSGAADYLSLSPLLSTMVMGIVLVNTSPARHQIHRVLEAGERPFYFVLLIFAGATWAPSRIATIPLVIAFLVARALAKIAGARLATRWNGLLDELGADWGRALIGQGGLAIALALDYIRRPGLLAPNVVFTASVLSVLLTEFAAARQVEAVLAPLLARRRRRRFRMTR